MNSITTHIKLTHRDADGSIINQDYIKGNSLLRNFASLLGGLFLRKEDADNLFLTDYTGASWTFNHFGNSSTAFPGVPVIPMQADHPSGSANAVWGIRVGSGNTAVTWEDFDLDTRINYGSDPGELQYGSTSGPNPETIPGGDRIVILGGAGNSAPFGSVTVSEVGLFVVSYRAADGTGHYTLIARDVVPSQSVAAGQSLELEYHIDIVLT